MASSCPKFAPASDPLHHDCGAAQLLQSSPGQGCCCSPWLGHKLWVCPGRRWCLERPARPAVGHCMQPQRLQVDGVALGHQTGAVGAHRLQQLWLNAVLILQQHAVKVACRSFNASVEWLPTTPGLGLKRRAGGRMVSMRREGLFDRWCLLFFKQPPHLDGACSKLSNPPYASGRCTDHPATLSTCPQLQHLGISSAAVEFCWAIRCQPAWMCLDANTP